MKKLVTLSILCLLGFSSTGWAMEDLAFQKLDATTLGHMSKDDLADHHQDQIEVLNQFKQHAVSPEYEREMEPEEEEWFNRQHDRLKKQQETEQQQQQQYLNMPLELDHDQLKLMNKEQVDSHKQFHSAKLDKEYDEEFSKLDQKPFGRTLDDVKQLNEKYSNPRKKLQSNLDQHDQLMNDAANLNLEKDPPTTKVGRIQRSISDLWEQLKESFRRGFLNSSVATKLLNEINRLPEGSPAREQELTKLQFELSKNSRFIDTIKRDFVKAHESLPDDIEDALDAAKPASSKESFTVTPQRKISSSDWPALRTTETKPTITPTAEFLDQPYFTQEFDTGNPVDPKTNRPIDSPTLAPDPSLADQPAATLSASSSLQTPRTLSPTGSEAEYQPLQTTQSAPMPKTASKQLVNSGLARTQSAPIFKKR